MENVVSTLTTGAGGSSWPIHHVKMQSHLWGMGPYQIPDVLAPLLGLPASSTVRGTFLLFINDPALRCLVTEVYAHGTNPEDVFVVFLEHIRAPLLMLMEVACHYNSNATPALLPVRIFTEKVCQLLVEVVAKLNPSSPMQTPLTRYPRPLPVPSFYPTGFET